VVPSDGTEKNLNNYNPSPMRLAPKLVKNYTTEWHFYIRQQTVSAVKYCGES